MSGSFSLSSSQCGPLSGRTKVPGDKSISHRSLIFGGLAIGETMISGLLESEDVLCTASAMRALGAQVEQSSDGLWRVYGCGIGGLHQPQKSLDMGNAGTAARLLIGLCATHPIECKFIGDESLSKRPMNRIIKPLTDMGAVFTATDKGTLPLTVQGPDTAMNIEYRLPVASAQVKSAILLAGLNAMGKTTVIEEIPTRDHTENMLRYFGLEVEIEKLEDGADAISILGRQNLSPCAIDVPGDPSSAAFLAVAASIIENSNITLSQIGVNERRIGLYQTLQEMGANIEYKYPRIEAGEKVADLEISANSDGLRGVEVPEDRVPSMIDEFPILAIAASCAKGTTKMTGLKELRVKESDRLQMMADGLSACGVKLEAGEDSLIIQGNGKPPKGGAMIKTDLDHRIAMSFLILGCVSEQPIEVDDASPINTSFPQFQNYMNELGANIQ